MGNYSSITPEQKLINLNQLHTDIELVMDIKINSKLNYNQIKLIKKVFSNLMRCAYFEQVTTDRLLQCLENHIKEWSQLNMIPVDCDEYVNKKFSHFRHFIDIYHSEVMKNDY